ncbi:leukotriene C4 synthase isoform X1 [Melopsittacus undulatus]|uniref:leukotriene C4 synthase isoform X1 n=1 Tax=Melopsittacus undulatus TaxID=13146 RepID=UPI00124373A9|nr:leukotriene C4 synthase-like isoform X1 [Melopsittacus undulatus]XP_030903272.1 leukotriene C4 synthase-like isoform X1 [Melopsittacus undulatus]
MLDQIHLLAAVTVLGVLEQAYFFLQVIYARRAFGISPPKISGPPEFERIFRAQVNSSEYFPIFLALLWQAGLFFHQGLAAALGLVYLYARYRYFMGYKASSSESISPGHPAFLPLSLHGAEHPPPSQSVTHCSVPHQCPRLQVLLPPVHSYRLPATNTVPSDKSTLT